MLIGMARINFFIVVKVAYLSKFLNAIFQQKGGKETHIQQVAKRGSTTSVEFSVREEQRAPTSAIIAEYVAREEIVAFRVEVSVDDSTSSGKHRIKRALLAYMDAEMITTKELFEQLWDEEEEYPRIRTVERWVNGNHVPPKTRWPWIRKKLQLPNDHQLALALSLERNLEE